MAERDILRIGKISSINYPNGTARVTYEEKGGSTTTEFSFLAWEYWMPKIGDQVVVAHRSNGASSAFILGPVWYNGHRPAEGFEGLYRKEFCVNPGQSYERYDANTGEYKLISDKKITLQVGASTITITGDSVTINSPAIYLN